MDKEKERLTYTVPEIAQLLGINTIKAYALTKAEGFPAIRLGKRIVVPKAAFERWLDETALDKQSYGIGKQQ